ncbi:fungal hydrophobin [Rhizopogon salebrosus TDB-379]|nr:fungal hydrophobin [Rhizopogon salebrosus TDB-379]
MFARFFAVATLAAVAVATPVAHGECDTGTMQCCKSSETLEEYNNSPMGTITGLLPIDLGLDTIVGLSCSAILGGSCTTDPMCCTGNQYYGLVNVGCTPINIIA